MSQKIHVQMYYEKDTKNMYRYEAHAMPGQPDPLVSTFYIRKSAFPDGAPRVIDLVVTVPTEGDLATP